MTIREKPKSVRQVEEEFGFPSEELLPTSTGCQTDGNANIERAKLLWENRRLLGRVTASGLLLAILVAVILPIQYTSTVRLMPPDQDSGTGFGMLAALAGKAGGALGGLGAELLGLKTSGDLFIGILQSRTVEDAIINKMDLRKEYGVARWEDTRRMLARRTAISQDRKSGILTIAVSDHSRERAKAIAQEYVVQLNQVVINMNTSSAHREREFLEERLKGVQEDLDSAQKQFSQFASKNTTIDLQAQSKAMIEAGATLTGELAAAETELEGLRQIYANGNVRVRAVQARIGELHRQLEKLGGSSATPTAADESASGANQSTLYPPIRELPILGVPYADLYRRVKVQEAVFETLTQEYELAKVEEAKETPSVEILDPADLPEKKSFPPRVAITLFGAMLACVAGSFWVLGAVRWRTIDPQHPGKRLVLEVLRSVAHGTFLSKNGTGTPVNGTGTLP